MAVTFSKIERFLPATETTPKGRKVYHVYITSADEKDAALTEAPTVAELKALVPEITEEIASVKYVRTSVAKKHVLVPNPEAEGKLEWKEKFVVRSILRFETAEEVIA